MSWLILSAVLVSRLFLNPCGSDRVRTPFSDPQDPVQAVPPYPTVAQPLEKGPAWHPDVCLVSLQPVTTKAAALVGSLFSRPSPSQTNLEPISSHSPLTFQPPVDSSSLHLFVRLSTAADIHPISTLSLSLRIPRSSPRYATQPRRRSTPLSRTRPTACPNPQHQQSYRHYRRPSLKLLRALSSRHSIPVFQYGFPSTSRWRPRHQHPFCAIQAGSSWRVCRWKELNSFAICQGPIRFLSRVYYRRCFPHPNHFARREHHCQVRDLGYGWSGALQVTGSHVLPKRQLRCCCLRHHPIRITRQGKGVGQGAPTPGKREHHHRSCRKQAGFGH